MWAAAALGGECVARVRLAAQTSGAAQGQVEIEVCREDGGFAVQQRNVSPEPARDMLRVKVAVVRRKPQALKEARFHYSASSELPMEQRESGLFFRTNAEDASERYELHCTGLAPDGKPEAVTVVPLSVAKPDITLRRPLEESEGSEGEGRIFSAAPKPMDDACVLRTRLEVPVLFGSAPLLVELYRSEGGYLLVTEDLTPGGSDAFRIAKIECGQRDGSVIDLLRPGTEAYDPESKPVISYRGGTHADRRGMGQFSVRAVAGKARTTDLPLRLTITLADEWNNVLDVIPVIIAQEETDMEK